MPTDPKCSDCGGDLFGALICHYCDGRPALPPGLLLSDGVLSDDDLPFTAEKRP